MTTEIHTEIHDDRIRETIAQVKGYTYRRFLVDHGTRNGKRFRKSFKTYAKAVRYLRGYDEDQEIEVAKNKILERRIGEDAGKLSNQQLREALTAFHFLSGKACLMDAVNFYLEHGQLKSPRTVSDFFADYTHFRTVTKKRRPHTLDEIKYRIGKFSEDFGKRLLHTITKKELQAWMEKKGGSAISQRHIRAQLSSFFKRAVQCEHVSEKLNPARGLEVPDVEKAIPYVLPVKDVESLLTTTGKHCPDMLPYFSICLFAGVRPTECRRLHFSKLNFDTKRIHIDSTISKTHDDRYVDMTDNLMAWLRPYRNNEGTIFFSGSSFNTIRTKAKIQWKSDCMRHSFGTYHVKLYENAGKTALQMGHKNTGILFEHYLNARFTKEDAEKFFEIRPAKKGKVIAGDFAKTA